MRNMNEDAKQLWALHVEGPDDVLAAPSADEAMRVAVKMQRWWEAQPHHEYNPVLKFSVVPWPHSPESHARDLPNWTKEFGDGND